VGEYQCSLGNTRKCWIRRCYWHLLCFHKTSK